MSIKKYLITLISIVSLNARYTIHYNDLFEFDCFYFKTDKKEYDFFCDYKITVNGNFCDIKSNNYLRKIIIDAINNQEIMNEIVNEIIQFDNEKKMRYKWVMDKFDTVNLYVKRTYSNNYVITDGKNNYYETYSDLISNSKYNLNEDYKEMDWGSIFLIKQFDIKIEDKTTCKKIQILSKYNNDNLFSSLISTLKSEIENFELSQIINLNKNTDFHHELIKYLENNIKKTDYYNVDKDMIHDVIDLGYVKSELESKINELMEERKILLNKNGTFKISVKLEKTYYSDWKWYFYDCYLDVNPNMTYNDIIQQARREFKPYSEDRNFVFKELIVNNSKVMNLNQRINLDIENVLCNFVIQDVNYEIKSEDLNHSQDYSYNPVNGNKQFNVNNKTGVKKPRMKNTAGMNNKKNKSDPGKNKKNGSEHVRSKNEETKIKPSRPNCCCRCC